MDNKTTFINLYSVIHSNAPTEQTKLVNEVEIEFSQWRRKFHSGYRVRVLLLLLFLSF